MRHHLPHPALTLAASVLAAAILSGPATATADSLSPGDRQRLVAHLELTEAWLADEVAGLSASQLAFRPSPEAWSVKDVVEHLAIAEPQYWGQVTESLKRAATGYKPETTDAAILWYGVDRTDRARTGEARVPDGRFKTAGDALGAFRTLRATILAYARTTTDDLRGRAFGRGPMDLYQWCLMISTHAQRHILQIREIKASAGYPKA